MSEKIKDRSLNNKVIVFMFMNNIYVGNIETGKYISVSEGYIFKKGDPAIHEIARLIDIDADDIVDYYFSLLCNTCSKIVIIETMKIGSLYDKYERKDLKFCSMICLDKFRENREKSCE